MPDCSSKEVEGCVDFKTAFGSSGIWTGARRELFNESVCDRRVDMFGCCLACVEDGVDDAS